MESHAKILCKFFNTKNGCRYGTQCRYAHIEVEKVDPDRKKENKKENQDQTQVIQNKLPRQSGPRKGFQRPQRQRTIEEELQYQVKQLSIRFPEGFQVSSESLSLCLKPTDPDFPYDLESLQIQFETKLVDQKIQIENFKVKNMEIPLLIKENIQTQFIWETSQHSDWTLLKKLQWLDKNLEKLMIMPKEKKQLINKDGKMIVQVQTQSDTKITLVGKTKKMETDLDLKLENLDINEKNDLESINQQKKTQNEKQIFGGIEIRLLDLKMVSISLLETLYLHLLIQCSKCKNIAQLENLLPNKSRPFICGKCHQTIQIYYRSQLIHQNSISIGTCSLEGCDIMDFLPCSFKPTCSECLPDEEQIQYQEPQFLFRKMQPSSPQTLSCRYCHAKMIFGFSAVRFVRLGTASSFGPITAEIQEPKVLPTKKNKPVKEPGIQPGLPLPEQGTCTHYKKSFRWLRFPCCGRAFPCDDCHQASNKDGHEMKLANKMICGFCSREQPFHLSKPCVHCGKDLTKSSGSTAFWEGGKGNRNVEKMSRRDPKKFKGLHKTQSKKSERVGPKSERN